jgi:glycosyltransferase involved in cell wall biosynthesis
MKLSVIVPVYNVEKYLPRCLDSLLRQGMKPGEWEVICVNDGSPDNCAAILAEYEAKHPDIFKIITQENQGLSAARNAAMLMARGEYVAFVDSDDYLIDGAYAYIASHFSDNFPDVIHFCSTTVWSDGKTIVDPDARPDGVIISDPANPYAYTPNMLPYVWMKWYKRDFLMTHQIFFPLVICEDILFDVEVFRHRPHTIEVSSNIYRYEQSNASSIMRLTDKKKLVSHLTDLLENIYILCDFLQNGSPEMVPFARRGIDLYLSAYYKKMIKARFSRREWKTWKQRLYEQPVHTMTYEGNAIARLVILMKNLSGHSFVFYWIMCHFREDVYATSIFPHLFRTLSRRPKEEGKKKRNNIWLI